MMSNKEGSSHVEAPLQLAQLSNGKGHVPEPPDRGVQNADAIEGHAYTGQRAVVEASRVHAYMVQWRYLCYISLLLSSIKLARSVGFCVHSIAGSRRVGRLDLCAYACWAACMSSY